MMTSAEVVDTSVTTTDNNPSQHYTHPNDQTTLLNIKKVAKFNEMKDTFSHIRPL